MPASPLTVLGRQLLAAAPPRLAALRDALLTPEGFVQFMDLVRQYTPDCEAEVLRAEGPGERMVVFANHFQDQYFPLGIDFDDPEYCAELGYSFMADSIHTVQLGFSDDDLHTIPEFKNGLQLLFVLARCCDAPTCFHDEGLRVPALESCAEFTQPAVLSRIPAEGYNRTELHRLLDGTEYQAAAKAGDWFYADTGNGFLDLNDDMDGNIFDPWEPETVAQMTRLWQEADLFTGQVHELAGWLEQDPSAHFGQLLDFIARRKEEAAHDRRQLRLIESFAPDANSGASDS